MIVISRATAGEVAAFQEAMEMGHYVRETSAQAAAIGDTRTVTSAAQIYNALWIVYYGEEARTGHKLTAAMKHLFLDNVKQRSMSDVRTIAEIAALSASVSSSRRAFTTLENIANIWPEKISRILNDEVNISFLPAFPLCDRMDSLRIVDTVVQANRYVTCETMKAMADSARHEIAREGAATLSSSDAFDYQRAILRSVGIMGLYAKDNGKKANKILLKAETEHPHPVLRSIAFHARQQLQKDAPRS